MYIDKCIKMEIIPNPAFLCVCANEKFLSYGWKQPRRLSKLFFETKREALKEEVCYCESTAQRVSNGRCDGSSTTMCKSL